MMKRILAVTIAVILVSGCLVKDTVHTLYLEPDGSITWTVLEKDIRSDADTREKRLDEEREFLAAFAIDEHPVALGLAALWPATLGSQLLRGQRPYTVRTSARFDSVAVLAQDIMDRTGVPGQAVLATEGDLTRLTITCGVDGIDESEDSQGEDDPLLALVGDLDGYRIMLTSGSFVDAHGFEIDERGSVAFPVEIDDDEIEANGGEIVLWLSWTTRER